jgi:hypothetical protein
MATARTVREIVTESITWDRTTINFGDLSWQQPEGNLNQIHDAASLGKALRLELERILEEVTNG